MTSTLATLQNLRTFTFNNHPTELEEGQLAFNLAAENQNLSEGNANIYMYVGNGSDLRMNEDGTVLVPGNAAKKGWIRYSLATLNTVADGAVTTAKIQNSSVTAAKLSIDDTVLPTVDNSFNLGSASFRFANIFTGDLHLKNDRGDWTIIEEDDCLTMRNNKTGKIYEIMMKERTA